VLQERIEVKTAMSVVCIFSLPLSASNGPTNLLRSKVRWPSEQRIEKNRVIQRRRKKRGGRKKSPYKRNRFEVKTRSVNGFRFLDGSNFAISHKNVMSVLY